MKISNSKKELARIISENGGWREGAKWAAQGGNHGHVGFASVAPVRHGKIWDMTQGFAGKFLADEILPNWHQTILSRAEFSHLYPAPDAKPRFCESVMRSIPEPDEQVWTNPPTIEQLASDYRNAKDYADRKQQEADDAKADADEKLRVLEIAGEALGLLVLPITTKQDPELVITDWQQLQENDVIRVHCFGNVYSECIVLAVYENDVLVRNHAGKKYNPSIQTNDWRFIRRP